MPKPYSGKAVISILIRVYGFQIVRQKGGHVKLMKSVSGTSVMTIVPLHRELVHGTLRSALQLARISYDDFCSHSRI